MNYGKNGMKIEFIKKFNTKRTKNINNMRDIPRNSDIMKQLLESEKNIAKGKIKKLKV